MDPGSQVKTLYSIFMGAYISLISFKECYNFVFYQFLFCEKVTENSESEYASTMISQFVTTKKHCNKKKM